ncbi:hypothetical protein [Microbacterium sp. NPDC056569]|uniref:hypothetical protein n=1 Tax=Microbacterium sp. NPDC056569 TaxID=3345867 RepID=UPI00366B7F8C
MGLATQEPIARPGTRSELMRPFRTLVSDVRARLRTDVETPGFRRLRAGNLLGAGRLSGGSGPVVSLTTFGDRTRWSYLAIQSIARGSLTPARTILWLDEPDAFRTLPRSLRRLRRRGLEVRLAENFGPHTKYFPFVEETAEFTGPLVTADDDTIYPRSWLARLVDEHHLTPDLIVCYRARRVTFDGADLAPYAVWDFSTGSEPSWAHFMTAVSGVIHPVEMLRSLKARGREFRELCPDADDVWMHNTSIKAGIRIRLIDGFSRTFPLVEETQEQALWYSNLTGGANDRQIAATYDDSEIALLRRETSAIDSADG